MATKKNNKPAKKMNKHVKVAKASKKIKIKAMAKSLKINKNHAKTVKAKARRPVKVKLSATALLKKAKMSSLKRAANAKSKKLRALKLEEQTQSDRRVEEVKRVSELVGNITLTKTVGTTVGAGAIDVLKTLVEGPKTDESIAEKLSIKVNDVRRMLNVMNSYSIVRYDVNKDNKGWLIFTWRIDSEKLSEYVTGINKETVVVEAALPGNCNDFFVCKGCYSKEKTVLPFDSAFESNFSCVSCGKPFALLSREETVALFKTVEA